MALMVDANVFIHFERRGVPIDLSVWEASEDVFTSVVTVSELLMGVHRADSEARRKRRSEFVARNSGDTILNSSSFLRSYVSCPRNCKPHRSMDQDEKRIHDFVVRFCDRVLQEVYEQKRQDSITEAAGLLGKRIVNGFISLHVLRENARHQWSIDGLAILRTIYDAMLQLLYILKSPVERDSRARQYLDFVWIEKHHMRHSIDESDTDTGKRLAASPKRAAGEPELDATLKKLGPKYLTEKGKKRHEKAGSSYLTDPAARYRTNWYLGGLDSLAEEVGYVSEYRLFQKHTSAYVHASPWALRYPPLPAKHLPIAAIGFVLRATNAIADVCDVELDEEEREVVEEYAYCNFFSEGDKGGR